MGQRQLQLRAYTPSSTFHVRRRILMTLGYHRRGNWGGGGAVTQASVVVVVSLRRLSPRRLAVLEPPSVGHASLQQYVVRSVHLFTTRRTEQHGRSALFVLSQRSHSAIDALP